MQVFHSHLFLKTHTWLCPILQELGPSGCSASVLRWERQRKRTGDPRLDKSPCSLRWRAFPRPAQATTRRAPACTLHTFQGAVSERDRSYTSGAPHLCAQEIAEQNCFGEIVRFVAMLPIDPN